VIVVKGCQVISFHISVCFKNEQNNIVAFSLNQEEDVQN